MVTISLCMIVKNEGKVLGRCLESVKGIVDEIVVVDTGSTDGTKAVAECYTDRIYDYPWQDDFAAARNFAFSKGTMEMLLWLDGDDVLQPKDREGLLDLKRTMPADVDVVMMKYHVSFDADGTPTFSYYRERLIRNAGKPLWQGAVHEVIAPFGKVVWSDVAVSHKKEGHGDPDRNLRIYESQVAQGVVLEPRARFYYARELYYHEQYQAAAGELRTFLDNGGGWVENEIEACRFLAYCKYNLNDPEGALHALLESFLYDDPRAETCCDLGRHFFDRENWHRAAFWYELALSRELDDRNGAFVQPDCYGYLPCIQLCVCYDRMAQREKAIAYNLRAGRYKPGDRAYQHNLAYFAEEGE